MDRESLECRIAFSFLKEMTPALLLSLEDCGIEEAEFFELDTRELSAGLGCGDKLRFQKLEREEALFRARKELEFISRHDIRPLSILDDDYPWLLKEVPDAPLMLYKLGEADLNGEHIMNIVGTRKPTNYGLDFCGRIVEELGGYFPDLTVVSGLAYGIDAAAHTAALEQSVTTVAVVAHGLDTLYPAANRDLARRIIKAGGAIITEYPMKVAAHRRHFLERNRIVAGMSELTMVAESPIKGGAMSTANMAFSYNREIMALPGRTTDECSAGCNLLIRKEKAHLVTCAADVIELMGWKPLSQHIAPRQRNLFPELEGDNKLIYEVLKFGADSMSVDELHTRTLIGVPALLSALTELEFEGIITRLPGNRYTIG